MNTVPGYPAAGRAPAPRLRAATVIRCRQLPELDDRDGLLDLAAEMQLDDEAVRAVCDRPELARAVAGLAEDPDLLRRRVAELERELKAQTGLTKTWERRCLAEADAHQVTRLRLEAAQDGAEQELVDGFDGAAQAICGMSADCLERCTDDRVVRS